LALQTTDFDYDLPPERIAQTPLEPRDASRLLVLDRKTGAVQHAVFREISTFLHPGDLLVLNQTRVIPARLFGHKVPSGGKVELLLLRREDGNIWEALIGGKGMIPGKRLQIEGGPEAEIVAALEGARRLVRFSEPVEAFLSLAGHMPLPPYIHTHLDDPERYQTVFARQPGSAAAPTAGLHFTSGLLEHLQAQGVGVAYVTLHVGLDTFLPVSEDSPEEHVIHSEWCHLSLQTAQAIQAARARGGRIIAVGTTSVRTLESAAAPDGLVREFEGSTRLFILPGYSFQVVDAMITNFHLPRSTLIMLVSAFAGRENILVAYQLAIQDGYRFYSFGDAMLIA
jgi:S-adenosylmethionine:tRNA ribosyltransferase-isomerase